MKHKDHLLKIAVIVTTVTLFVQALPVYASELLSESSAAYDISGADESSETGKSSETDEVFLSDEDGKPDEGGIPDEVVTAVECPDVTEYTFDYKTSLDILVKEFPKSVTVHYGNVTAKADAVWICENDYNKTQEEYIFIPDMKGYTLAEDVDIPRLSVTFEKEKQRPVAEPIDDYQGYEIPFLSGGNDLKSDLAGGTGLPDKYNLFEDNKLPPVRDQGDFDTCWAFSAIGAVETDLMHDGTIKAPDLSELHLAYYASNQYNDPRGNYHFSVKNAEGVNKHWINNRGEAMAASRLFSNLVGIVSESDVPYSKGKSFAPTASYTVSKDSVRMENAYFINPADKDNIKKAIMEHNGVSAKYFDGSRDDYFNSVNSAYYCTLTGGNHLVMLVGWDDNFAVEKFNANCRPEGPGAWLVRNSWGQNGYGYSGYFWLSYYDKSFNNQFSRVVAFDAVTDTYDNCYAYDGAIPLMVTHNLTKDDTVKLTYNIKAHETIRAMAFETGSANVTAQVTVKNLSNGKSVSKSINTSHAGIYTVEFDNGLYVPSASKVELSIKFKSGSNDTALICESANSTQLGARKYTGINDNGFDVVTNGKRVHYDYDPRLKLYTDDTVIPVKSVSLNKKKLTVVKGYSVKLKATVSPSDAANKKVTWKSSDKKIASVDKSGNVKGKKKGTATITVTTTDGKKTATCKVTVKNPVKVRKVKLNKKNATVKKGKTITLKATVSPKNATNKEVTWKSSNKKIATVDKNGKVKGVKKGTATIKVTTKDGKKKASCKVTVK